MADWYEQVTGGSPVPDPAAWTRLRELADAAFVEAGLQHVSILGLESAGYLAEDGLDVVVQVSGAPTARVQVRATGSTALGTSGPKVKARLVRAGGQLARSMPQADLRAVLAASLLRSLTAAAERQAPPGDILWLLVQLIAVQAAQAGNTTVAHTIAALAQDWSGTASDLLDAVRAVTW